MKLSARHKLAAAAVGFVLYWCAVAALGAEVLPAPAADSDYTAEQRELASRCVHRLICAQSKKPVEKTRKPLGIGGRGLYREGWEWTLTTHCVPQMSRAGCDTLFLGMPFGINPGKPYPWTARVMLQRIADDPKEDEVVRHRARLVLESFLPAMRKFLRGDLTGGEPQNLIAYLGTYVDDPLLTGVTDRAEYDALWWDSVWPAVELAREFPGRVTVGADKTARLTDDDWHFDNLRALESLGVRILTEPRPLRVNTHLHAWDWCGIWRQDGKNGEAFDRTDPDRFQDARRWSAFNRELTGRRYAIFNNEKRLTWDQIRQAIEAGATPILSTRDLEAIAGE